MLFSIRAWRGGCSPAYGGQPRPGRQNDESCIPPSAGFIFESLEGRRLFSNVLSPQQLLTQTTGTTIAVLNAALIASPEVPVCSAEAVVTPANHAGTSKVTAPPANANGVKVNSVTPTGNGAQPVDPSEFLITYDSTAKTLNVTPDEFVVPGDYTVVVSLLDSAGNVVATINLKVTVQ